MARAIASSKQSLVSNRLTPAAGGSISSNCMASLHLMLISLSLTMDLSLRYTSTGIFKPFFLLLSLMTLLLLTTVHFLLSFLHQNSFLLFSVNEVKSKLANIKVSKAAGPDGILNRVLKEFSDELAYPFC